MEMVCRRVPGPRRSLGIENALSVFEGMRLMSSVSSPHFRETRCIFRAPRRELHRGEGKWRVEENAKDRMMGENLRADAALDKHLLAKIRCLGKGWSPLL